MPDEFVEAMIMKLRKMIEDPDFLEARETEQLRERKAQADEVKVTCWHLDEYKRLLSIIETHGLDYKLLQEALPKRTINGIKNKIRHIRTGRLSSVCLDERRELILRAPWQNGTGKCW